MLVEATQRWSWLVMLLLGDASRGASVELPGDAPSPRPGLGHAVLRRGRRTLSRWVRPALDARGPRGLLTTAQLAALRALTEIVAAGGPINDDDWAPIAGALAMGARERPGFHALCVRACRLLDRLGPHAFAEATPAERARSVAAHRLAVRPVPAPELLLVGRRVEHEIRDLLVPELIRAYFDAPVGWRLVGYTAVLGECREPFAYTRAPE
jgi:hypothetical protein